MRLAVSTRRLRAGALALCLSLAPGCKGDGGPAGLNPVIAGSWSGSAKAGLVQFEATFTQPGGNAVGGTGQFSSPIAADDFTVQGTLSGTTVNLVLTSDELGATTFAGRFTGANRIEGKLELGDGEQMDLTLDRE